MQTHTSVKKMVLLAMLAATAYIIVALIRIPVVAVPPLSYEAKDVVITIGGFMLGPMAAFIISLVVSLVEMVTISTTGPIGAIMNLLSSCSFACVASLIYKKKHTIFGALMGLICGTVTMVALMILWNWLITPIYLGYPRAAVEIMLIPIFLPFNALKGGLNTALVLALYKPLTTALRRAHLLPQTTSSHKKAKPGVYILAGLLLATCVLLLLVMKGII